MPCGKRPLVKSWDKPRHLRVIKRSPYEQTLDSVKVHWQNVIKELEMSYKDQKIEFDTHVARSLRVVPKELPSVEEKIAVTTGNPEMSRYATLDREITKDIRADLRPVKIKAFNQSLPMQVQYHPSRNHTKRLWRSARHVPRDLFTLKTVWEGITNLRSVKEYFRWMIHHPDHRRPPYLNSLGLFDPAVLEARLTLEAEYQMTPPVESPHDIPAPIGNIRKRLSDLIDSV